MFQSVPWLFSLPTQDYQEGNDHFHQSDKNDCHEHTNQELGAQEMIEDNEENFKKFIAGLAEDLMKQ